MLGPPGAGKGTVSDLLQVKLRVPHISTGQLFRKEIEKGSAIGKQVEKLVGSGALAPDELTLEVLTERIKDPDCKKGFTLDGYPRNPHQAVQLDELVAKIGKKVDLVAYIDVDADLVVKRLSNRVVCSVDGTNYNLAFSPPKHEGKCDKCGAELVHRKDDQPEVIRNRLNIYQEQTFPVAEFYKKSGKLVHIHEEDNQKVIQIIESELAKRKAK